MTPATITRTFRVTVDIETTVHATPNDAQRLPPAHVQYHHALVQQLRAHPTQLDHLLRAAATAAMKHATQQLIADYGWGSGGEQQTLQPLIAKLAPAAQRYFTEEVADGASVYYFDGYDATILQMDITELA